jgi:hypothetical protein
MSTVPRILSAATLVACLLGVAACGAGPETADPAAPATSDHAAHSSAAVAPTASGSLDVDDQTSDGTSVTVASVEIEAGGNGGWIALHEDAGGKPGPVTYFVAVPAGASADVVVPTPGGIATAAFWPMLHVDDGVAGSYEFPTTPGADMPVTDGNEIVMTRILVTVG